MDQSSESLVPTPNSFELRDYQRRFVEVGLKTEGIPLYLQATPGSGRAVAVTGWLARVLAEAEPGSRRALIITSPRFFRDWESVIQKFGGMHPLVLDSGSYRRLEARWKATERFLTTYPVVISSPSIFRIVRDRADIESLDWTALVLDEMNMWRDEEEKVVRDIWRGGWARNRVGISEESVPEWAEGDMLTTRWGPRDIAREPHSDPPTQVLQTVTVLWTNAEHSLLLWLKSALADVESSPEPQKDILKLCRRMWHLARSSIYAFEQEVWQHVAIRRKSIPKGRERHGQAILHLKQAETLLGVVEQLERDSKWETLLSIIEDAPMGEALWVFAEHEATAEYVVNLCRAEDIDAARLGEIRDLIRLGTEPMGALADVVVSTLDDAAVPEETELSNLVVHYDLPSSSELNRRFLRAEVVGARQGSDMEHVFLVDSLGASIRRLRAVLRTESNRNREIVARKVGLVKDTS